ncbi:MspA family porin [Gordonia soli]|uniref:MspA family protein n=1 Tax=Gordonia soli NBRC 108243 TaxID=1223545 RepID=M0QQF3_9ACTN|nr:MspA family porin [Gordonia soli]GAC70890.1 hypothetical protein GS4_43_00160 [Gordonia soli NBRC 108243]
MTRHHRHRPSLRRAAGLTAALVGAGTLAALATPGTAFADSVIRLPGGTAHGDGLSITRSAESARVSPSLAANGASRTAWVSGQVTLKAPHLKPKKAGPTVGAGGEDKYPGTQGVYTNGAAAKVSSGYIVGCQVNIEGLSGGLSGALSLTAPSASANLTVPLSAGQVKFVVVTSRDIEKPGTYHLGYQNAGLEIQNCGGYAQARAFTTVETTGEFHQKVNLYGKPFSIG